MGYPRMRVMGGNGSTMPDGHGCNGGKNPARSPRWPPLLQQGTGGLFAAAGWARSAPAKRSLRMDMTETVMYIHGFSLTAAPTYAHNDHGADHAGPRPSLTQEDHTMTKKKKQSTYSDKPPMIYSTEFRAWDTAVRNPKVNADEVSRLGLAQSARFGNLAAVQQRKGASR